MDRTQYSAQRRMILAKFGHLGISGVSRAFPLLKATDDPAADAARYEKQLEEMRDNLQNTRAAHQARAAHKRRL